MSAKDYHICPALFNAYIAKISKRDPNLMTNDRRVITDNEIMTLVDWWLDKKAEEGASGIGWESTSREGYDIILNYSKRK